MVSTKIEEFVRLDKNNFTKKKKQNFSSSLT